MLWAEENEVSDFGLRKVSIATLFLVIPDSVVAMPTCLYASLIESPILTFAPMSYFGVIDVPCGHVYSLWWKRGQNMSLVPICRGMVAKTPLWPTVQL